MRSATVPLESSTEQLAESYADRREPNPRRKSQIPLLGAGLAALAIVLVAGVVLPSRNRSGPDVATAAAVSPTTTVFKAGPCPTPQPRPAHPDQAWRNQDDEAHARLQDEIDRTGFGRYSAPGQDGTQICGWIKVRTPTMDEVQAFRDGGGADVVYDAPNGKVMGRAYMYLGYFPEKVVTAPGFDPKRMRVQRYGCDPLDSASGCATPPSTILDARSAPTG